MAHRIFLAFAGGLLLSSPVLAQTAPAIPNPPPPPAQSLHSADPARSSKVTLVRLVSAAPQRVGINANDP